MKARRQRFWSLREHGITQGAMHQFLQCPRKAHWALRCGLRSRRGSSQALDFGNLVHEILGEFGPTLQKPAEHGHRMEHVCNFLDQFIDGWVDRQRTGLESSQEIESLEEVATWASAILPHYFFFWEETHDISWETTEEEFAYEIEVPWEEPAVLRGKFDGTFRSHGSLWLVEHKTRSQISPESIAAELPFDLQVCLYSWVLGQLAREPVRGVLYNIIRRPSKRPHKNEKLPDYRKRLFEDVGERRDFYFMRFEMALLEDDLRRWRNEFGEMVYQLREWENGAFNYRNSNGCDYCPYISLCGGSANLLDYRLAEDVFPELELDHREILNRRSQTP